MKWFQNLRVKSKLIIGFAIVIAFSIVLAVIAISTVNRLDSSYSYLLEYPQKRVEYLMTVDSESTAMRQSTTALMLNYTDSDKVKSYWDQFELAYKSAVENMDKYIASNEADTVRDSAVLNANSDVIDNLKIQLESYREQAQKGRDAALAGGSFNEVNAIFLAGTAIISEITTTVGDLIPKAVAYTAEMSVANTAEKDFSVFLLYVIIAVIVILSAVIAVFIARLISKPLTTLTGFMNRAGSTGNISLRKEDEESIAKYALIKDETGQCINSTAGFVRHITTISKVLEDVAGGDLSVDIKLLSDADTMGISVQKMVDNLNSMFGEIHSSTTQVSTGAKQVADGSQALAQGSTEQAAAVEQLSSSISEIAGKTKANAEMAGRAANLANTIKNNAEKGSVQMDHMMGAVREINQASQSINKVIKVIDDIAFQTNILALNAAVEAARAGQHGKGFAVVAEEVRNLAAKSADAAKDTGGLIANSMEKAELGARIADETAASLVEIVSGISESNQLIGEIARSSDEQSAGIVQINKGIDQVAQVIQQNSATAEESAAASEEMSGQSDMLTQLISQFKLKGDGMDGRGLPPDSLFTHKRLSMPGKTGYTAETGGDYGKY